MALPEALCKIIDLEPSRFSRHENILLEAELFFTLCEKLSDRVQEPLKQYSAMIKNNYEKESFMLEDNFIKCLVNDILISGAYTVQGIAHYTNSPEEVIYDIMAGTNASPSLALSRKIFELHREIRPELYKAILLKAFNEREDEGLC